MIRTQAIFKTIVTLKNGAHKIVRLSIDKVAKLVRLFREAQRDIFCDEVLFYVTNEDVINVRDILRAKFVNERTRTEFLTIE